MRLQHSNASLVAETLLVHALANLSATCVIGCEQPQS